MNRVSGGLAEGSEIAVWAENLGYSYAANSVPALRGVNLTIPGGQLVAVLGANGSGKSTLAKLLAGLLAPSAGRLEILGHDLVDMQSAEALRGRAGIVFQSPDQQMVAMTVEREIAFGPENLGLPPAEIRSRVRAMLQQFKLESLAQRLPNQLSGGEKQRLALASVLAMQPELLILDEVTSLLDPGDRKEILRSIRDWRGQRTIIMITQFAEEALIADRALLLHEGRIVSDGTPEEIFASATSSDLFGVEVPLAYRILNVIDKISNT